MLIDVVELCGFEEKVRLENLRICLELDFCYFVKDHDRY